MACRMMLVFQLLMVFAFVLLIKGDEHWQNDEITSMMVHGPDIFLLKSTSSSSNGDGKFNDLNVENLHVFGSKGFDAGRSLQGLNSSCPLNTWVPDGCCQNTCGLDCGEFRTGLESPRTSYCMITATGCLCADACEIGWDRPTECCKRNCDLDCSPFGTEFCAIYDVGCQCHDPTPECRHQEKPIESNAVPVNGRFENVPLDLANHLTQDVFLESGAFVCESQEFFAETDVCKLFFGTDKPFGRVAVGSLFNIDNIFPTLDKPFLTLQYLPIFGDLNTTTLNITALMRDENGQVADRELALIPFAETVFCRDLPWNTVELNLTDFLVEMNYGVRRRYISMTIATTGIVGLDNIEFHGPPAAVHTPEIPVVALDPLETRFSLPTIVFFLVPSAFAAVFILSTMIISTSKPMSTTRKNVTSFRRKTVALWSILSYLLLGIAFYELIVLDETIEEFDTKQKLRVAKQEFSNFQNGENSIFLEDNIRSVGGNAQIIWPVVELDQWQTQFGIKSCESIGANLQQCVDSADDFHFQGSVHLLGITSFPTQETLRNALFVSFGFNAVTALVALVLLKLTSKFQPMRKERILFILDALFILGSLGLTIYVAYLAFVRPIDFASINVLTEIRIDGGSSSPGAMLVTLKNAIGDPFIAKDGSGDVKQTINFGSIETCFNSQVDFDMYKFVFARVSFYQTPCFPDHVIFDDTTNCVKYNCPPQDLTVGYEIDYKDRQQLIEKSIIQGVVFVDLLVTAVDVLVFLLFFVGLRSREQAEENQLDAKISDAESL